MNFSFYIYGTPDGYNQYPADNNSTLFQDFAQNNTTESQLTVCRKGHLVYYAYLRRLQEESNSYLGFCLTFNGVYCQNLQKLFALFDRVFDDVLMKGEFAVRIEKEKCTYLVSKFTDRPFEIERIKEFFKYELENNYNRYFAAISASFKFGNGKKTVSIKETNSDILAAIAEYDCVHISNNEKSLFDQISLIIIKAPKWLWWVLAAAATIIVSLVLFIALSPEKIVEVEQEIKYTLPETNRQFTYTGEFKNDTIPHGKGVATFGNHIYEGEFVDGKIEGTGKITYTRGNRTGDIMEGQFINNDLDSGVFISPSNRCKTEGIFRNREIFDGVFVDTITQKISIYKNGQITDVKSLKIEKQ